MEPGRRGKRGERERARKGDEDKDGKGIFFEKLIGVRSTTTR